MECRKVSDFPRDEYLKITSKSMKEHRRDLACEFCDELVRGTGRGAKVRKEEKRNVCVQCYVGNERGEFPSGFFFFGVFIHMCVI